jgi:hypothetical protein
MSSIKDIYTHQEHMDLSNSTINAAEAYASYLDTKKQHEDTLNKNVCAMEELNKKKVEVTDKKNKNYNHWHQIVDRYINHKISPTTFVFGSYSGPGSFNGFGSSTPPSGGGKKTSFEDDKITEQQNNKKLFDKSCDTYHNNKNDYENSLKTITIELKEIHDRNEDEKKSNKETLDKIGEIAKKQLSIRDDISAKMISRSVSHKRKRANDCIVYV